jgi:hypothetical protein
MRGPRRHGSRDEVARAPNVQDALSRGLATEPIAGRHDAHHSSHRTAAPDRRQHWPVSRWRRGVGRGEIRRTWHARLEETPSERRPRRHHRRAVADGATVDDGSVGAGLIGTAAGDAASVAADAAYDTVAFHEAARARHAQVVVPPIMTARVSRHGPRSTARDRSVTDVDTLGRRQWKKASGYHSAGPRPLQAHHWRRAFARKCQWPGRRGEPCVPHPEPDDRA